MPLRFGSGDQFLDADYTVYLQLLRQRNSHLELSVVYPIIARFALKTTMLRPCPIWTRARVVRWV